MVERMNWCNCHMCVDYRRIQELTKALTAFCKEFKELGESGDCDGWWDAEEQEIVIEARKALEYTGIELGKV